MAKKVAVLAVNPVNGCGLFQYLEAFFENGISYKVFAVSDTKEIKTNSGISLTTDDVIANLKGHEDEFDAFVFSCGDAVPVFQQNADKPYNIDLMEVIKTFGDKGKIMIGHCAGAMMFDFTGITKGKKAPAAVRRAVFGSPRGREGEEGVVSGRGRQVQDRHGAHGLHPRSGVHAALPPHVELLEG